MFLEKLPTVCLHRIQETSLPFWFFKSLIKFFSAKYHTFLHKPLTTPVFMRSLAMYDGTNIIHKSYIILHKTAKFSLFFLFFQSRQGYFPSISAGKWTLSVHFSLPQTILSEATVLAQGLKRQWTKKFKAVGIEVTGSGHRLPKQLYQFWATE